ncbi:MAG: N-acetylmuramoyl-L-alanine amidase [Myxococcota bacterium]|nr:N-acetylmuramoyl-L-alanine amidase [Myxococcota bacterium]
MAPRTDPPNRSLSRPARFCILWSTALLVLTSCSSPEAIKPPQAAPVSVPSEVLVAPEERSEVAEKLLPVRARRSWSAEAPGPGQVEHRVERLSVHHTASPGAARGKGAERVRKFQRYHQEHKGWPDIAYHFVISPAGTIYEGRSTRYRGDTATSYDTTGHFLVALDGNFEEGRPSDEAMLSLSQLLAWASQEFAVPAQTISGHREHAATACPGKYLARTIEDGSLLKGVQSRIAAGPIRIERVEMSGEGAPR